MSWVFFSSHSTTTAGRRPQCCGRIEKSPWAEFSVLKDSHKSTELTTFLQTFIIKVGAKWNIKLIVPYNLFKAPLASSVSLCLAKCNNLNYDWDQREWPERCPARIYSNHYTYTSTTPSFQSQCRWQNAIASRPLAFFFVAIFKLLIFIYSSGELTVSVWEEAVIFIVIFKVYAHLSVVVKVSVLSYFHLLRDDALFFSFSIYVQNSHILECAHSPVSSRFWMQWFYVAMI